MKITDEPRFADEAFPIRMRRSDSAKTLSLYKSAIHEAIEIKLFYEGESTLLVGDEAISVQSGDIVFVNPYEFHATLDPGSRSNGKYILINIGTEFFSGALSDEFNLKKLIFTHNIRFKPLIRDKQLAKILCAAFEEYEGDGRTRRLAVFGLMAQFFAALLQNENLVFTGDTNNNDTARRYASIEPAMRMIRDDYAKSFTLDTLADACMMSKYHFSRRFKLLRGVSPMQYLTNYRLTVADILIRSGGVSVAEVAEQTGFNDTDNFTRLYKRRFGYTPSAMLERKKL